MISAARVIYAEAYEGTDIISHFAEIYHAARPYIMLRQQYIINDADFIRRVFLYIEMGVM